LARLATTTLNGRAASIPKAAVGEDAAVLRERFPTVEINYTFYRSPNEKILDGWNKATPAHFKLTLKAPRRITHDRRLRDCADLVRQFLEDRREPLVQSSVRCCFSSRRI
jgi:uncharacterized protein YecE (DUF72 family)